MFKDDDEEEENTFGVTRYPCMPSLVALQQMRNRLHLAFLGRKLMKWTALATGREMRRLASELYDVYQGFGEDMRNAFILLARGRYFVPQLNSIVTEDINNKAGVVVQQSSKAVSGVKIVQFEIFETESPPYPHLGIEKGGQAILEAKKAWLDLLKRLIMMMQLRASFLMVELANKNATKKMNVLSKIVIPKTNVTMGYINNELEEYAREEFFRLKKVLEIKRKMYGGIQDPKGKKKKEGAEENSLCIACKEEISEQKTEKAPIAIIDKSPEPKPVLEPESISSQENKLNDEEIDKLIKQLNEIVDVTTDMDEKGLLKASVDDFLKTAQVLKSKLGQKSEKQNEEVDVVQSLPFNTILPDNIDMDKLCDTCKEKYSKSNDKETQTDPTQNEEEKEYALNEKESEEKAKSPSLHDSESDAELGTFETEFKEITKITKTVNEDGSVTIKKKVIKIEREIRTPVRSKTSSSRTSTNKSNVTGRSANSSSHSNPYSGSRTVGLVTLKNPTSKDNLLSLYSIQRRVKSEILNTFSPMSAPIERFCMSSTTIVSSDIDFDYPMNDNNDNLSSSIRNNVRPSNNEA